MPSPPLPARLSSFIGREREIQTVVGLLDEHRLVTLVGAPGVGKTRLALRVAAGLQDRLSDGVVFVELAGLAEPELVPGVIATSLGVDEQGSRSIVAAVTDALQGRDILIVLDNCEHLITSCAAVVERLLSGCPTLRMLTTSREALRCEGELLWRVPSLTTPAIDEDAASTEDATELMSFEAIRLFVDRARAVRSTFTLNGQNAPTVAVVCQRLDGIPLAIELAAARVAFLSVEEIAARLDDQFRLLTAGVRTALPRQQTLEATIGWSHRLLSGPEQILLRRLSVFAGGWTLDAAEHVCHDGWDDALPLDVIEGLARLVERSLVQVNEGSEGETRYRFLEMIRQYAFERLVEAGEANAARDRHFDWLLRRVEKTEPLHYWAPPVVWLDRLEADHDNLRAALDWSLTSPGFSTSDETERRERGLRLALALFWPWFNRGRIGELCWWIETLLELPVETRSRLRARAYLAASMLAWQQRQLVHAASLLDRGVRLAREVGDTWAVAWSTELRAAQTRTRGELTDAASLMEDGLALFTREGDQWGISWSLRDLGSIALYLGDFPRARALLEQSLEESRTLRDDYCASLSLVYLGQVAYQEQQFDQAATLFEEANTIARRLQFGRAISQSEQHLGKVACARGRLDRAAALLLSSLVRRQRMGERGGVAESLEALAEVAHAMREPCTAGRLLGAATAIRADGSSQLPPVYDLEGRRRLESTLTVELGEIELKRCRALGEAMSIDQAVDEAQELSAKVHAAAIGESLEAARTKQPGSPVNSPLTAREHEVTALLTQGLTNRQIAAELVVSKRTVDAHVASILSKLGFATRAQVAVWASEHGLMTLTSGRH